MSIREIAEDIRRNKTWPPDDVIFVIHTNKANRAKVEKALQDVGIKDHNGVEIIPEEKEKDYDD